MIPREVCIWSKGKRVWKYMFRHAADMACKGESMWGTLEKRERVGALENERGLWIRSLESHQRQEE